MKIYLIDDIQNLQQHLAQQFQLHQVIANHDGQHHWQQVNTKEFPPLSQEKPQSSAKNYFFAEQESLLIFNGEYFQETLPSPAPFVLFGVQSCDLTAIHYQDKFFNDDPYYQARRQQCLLVGIDCIAPCEFGFCKTVNAGPGVQESHADLVLHPLNNNQWLLLEQTSKGSIAIEGLALTQAHWHHLTQRDLTLHQCEDKFPNHDYINQGVEKLNSGAIANDFWQKVAIQCLGCSGCTTLCPTCSCYGTKSIAQENSTYKQQRFWDSCLYEGFQKEASFNNPSVTAGSRVKHFWYHKFSNDFLSEFSRYGCVGCGRCEQTCPGVLGVHSVMKRISQEVNDA